MRLSPIDPTRADSAAKTLRRSRGKRGSTCLATSAGPMVLSRNTSSIAAPSICL
jgi:hypothetical protein